MDLVNLMYRYINKFINCDELFVELNNIDLTNYSKNEIKVIKKLIKDVQIIKNSTPNEFDEVEKARILKIDHILEILGNSKQMENSDEKLKEFINNQHDKLLNEKKIIRDGGELYNSLFELLTSNSLVKKYSEKMSDEELLEFITNYISVPVPPVINQEQFNNLVSVGIKKDKREALWRLAFNYNHKDKDFSLIEDYFIKKKDGYYLIELLNALNEDIDMDRMIQKVITTKDKEFMIDCARRAKRLDLITDEDIKRIKEQIESLSE